AGKLGADHDVPPGDRLREKKSAAALIQNKTRGCCAKRQALRSSPFAYRHGNGTAMVQEKTAR
ncbi:MAG: hypothetical protein IJU32_04065, partial [Pyramidobacter sp.]|nr:hypothetical protein [Pyramidobacter sp.]